jgi:hypothetical protein
MERHKTIAAHYRFIFNQLFDCFGFPKVIVLEVRLHSPPLPQTRHHTHVETQHTANNMLQARSIFLRPQLAHLS